MQSTQQVEKMHHLIKQIAANKMTPLKDLFETIEQRISDEKRTVKYINSQLPISAARMEHQFSAKIFSSIEKVNSQFLAKFALFRMRTEMTLVIFYRHRDHSDIDLANEKIETKDIVVRYLYIYIFLKNKTNKIFN